MGLSDAFNPIFDKSVYKEKRSTRITLFSLFVVYSRKYGFIITLQLMFIL